MTGGEIICAGSDSMLEQETPADQAITRDAWIGGQSMRIVIDKYRNAMEAEYLRTKPFKISDARRRIYTTIGGTPHLDGAYTVFGEVVSGMEIVDQIAAVQTDTNDRPVQDIRMTIKVLQDK